MKPTSKFPIIFFIACLFSCCLNNAIAKHMGLSSLTYTHLSGNLYHFQFIYYRDCFGIVPQQSVALNISSYACGVTQNVSMPVSGQGELITPVCSHALSTCDGGQEPGIQKWIYETDVNILGQCTDWKFSVTYGRSLYFSNVAEPFYDAYAETRLDNSIHDNSSPEITNEAIMFICMGQDFHFNNGFVDPDGDSLTIIMVPAMMTENSNIIYKSGFSAFQPVTSIPAATFDPASGDLLMHPTLPEISIMSFQVNEFRNGELIGRMTRDIGFYTINCTDAPPKLTGVDGTPKYFSVASPGTQLCFDILSNDINGTDSLFLNWNHGISSATFISDSAKHPTGTFCWTPSITDVRSSPYYFTATVRDNACPMNNVQTYTYAVYVSDNPSPFMMNTSPQGSSNDLLIYPNPTSGLIHFNFYNTIDGIRIYDHAGNLILADKLRSSDYKIDEPAGVYLVEIHFNDGRILKNKILVE